MPNVARVPIATSVLAVFLAAVATVGADDGATVSPVSQVPALASSNSLQLTLSAQSSHQYTVIPLTQNPGLNGSLPSPGYVKIVGNLRAATATTYFDIKGPQDVAYLSCDGAPDTNFINPNRMFNELMKQKPNAIVLYSTSQNMCDISSDSSGTFPYDNILTMADAGEASNLLNHLNASKTRSVGVTISGNATDGDNEASGGSNNSAVAMSILYSITGLITLLFLVIIATGAIRAHRYPERYGPRNAIGGRARQSRAKGLARAVLDTIPIVKFGPQESTKVDPQLELEASTSRSEPGTQMTRPSMAEEASTAGGAGASRRQSRDTTTSGNHSADNERAEEDHLGCSICTEDFKVGEDVRVLPCNHQFHPNCVDPWLIDVSGTCPLCRLDLRPSHANARKASTAGDDESIAPPLALEAEDGRPPSSSRARRFSRLLDINRLRQAPVEERIEALRQMRARTSEHEAADAEAADRPHAVRLADKLKDKFRIRTRPQPAERVDG
ncbi:RING-7 protein [Drechmeria coniospora]|uniref:RING-type E3 ubiquitin transferase n=1 Tax=Drechmeria coniospora TaxID=98403 RepID=A0A151GF63_DRECN|nr:RING-7 protein [Drechmeria coniospora]KYK55701.1 RING-7 protein [Drechmeria coniospora]